MNIRSRRRRVSRLFYGRFNGEIRWISVEEQAWLDIVPIGREFGSKDYERLEILDAFTAGRIDEQKAQQLLGISHEALVAMVENEGLPKQFASHPFPD